MIYPEYCHIKYHILTSELELALAATTLLTWALDTGGACTKLEVLLPKALQLETSMLTGAATMADPATKAVEVAIASAAEECRRIKKTELSDMCKTGAWNGCKIVVRAGIVV